MCWTKLIVNVSPGSTRRKQVRADPLPGGILGIRLNHSDLFLCVSKQTAGTTAHKKPPKERVVVVVFIIIYIFIGANRTVAVAHLGLCACPAAFRIKRERTRRLQCAAWLQSYFVTSNLCVWLMEPLHLSVSLKGSVSANTKTQLKRSFCLSAASFSCSPTHVSSCELMRTPPPPPHQALVARIFSHISCTEYQTV